MKNSSFAEILVDKILSKSDQFSNGSNPLYIERDTSPAYLSYLLGQINPHKTQNHFSQTQYKKYQPKEKPKRRPHLLSDAQKNAYQFFIDLKSNLDPGFSYNELKKAYRSLAIKLHPDHGGTSTQFIKLKKAFDSLLLVQNLK